MPYLRVLSRFRDEVRRLAREKADSSAILALSDRLRDEDMVDLGVALDDQEGQPSVFERVAFSLTISQMARHWSSWCRQSSYEQHGKRRPPQLPKRPSRRQPRRQQPRRRSARSSRRVALPLARCSEAQMNTRSSETMACPLTARKGKRSARIA